MTSRLRILCVTRAYPPVVGGMERLSFEFTEALKRRTPTTVVANRAGKSALPFFLPRAAVALRRVASAVDVIHLGDASLSVLLPFIPSVLAGNGATGDGWVSSGRRGSEPPSSLRDFGGPGRAWGRAPAPRSSGERSGEDPSRSERSTLGIANGRLETRRHERSRRGIPLVAVTIHGLDLRYPNALYQGLLRRFLPRVDLALCISAFVANEVRAHFPEIRTHVMTPGLQTSFALPGATRATLETRLDRPLGTGLLLLVVARLVRRKGLVWFVEDVLPGVPDATLLIIGDGPERTAIVEAARRAGIERRVILAGAQDRDLIRLAYNTADLLVMPNISVPGDAEGFGIVAIEAASAGLPVVAARLEGIPDAVIDGTTGILVSPQDSGAWREVLTSLLADAERRDRIRRAAPDVIHQRFSWDQRVTDVLAAFHEIRAPATPRGRNALG